MKKSNPDYQNGVPELVILKILSKSEMYGYEIARVIRSQSEEHLSYGEGCIYPSLHTLHHKGHLSCRSDKVNGRERYYYKITAKGKKRLLSLTHEWKNIAQGVNLILENKHVYA